jgi:hypothetical protein
VREGMKINTLELRLQLSSRSDLIGELNMQLVV